MFLQINPWRGWIHLLAEAREGSRWARGLRGIVPALAGRLRERNSFRAMREGWVGSPSMLSPARSRCCWLESPCKSPKGDGGPKPRTSLRLGPSHRGILFQSRRRMGSWAGLGGSMPALAGRLRERIGFRTAREGRGLFAFNARSGTVPLPRDNASVHIEERRERVETVKGSGLGPSREE